MDDTSGVTKRQEYVDRKAKIVRFQHIKVLPDSRHDKILSGLWL